MLKVVREEVRGRVLRLVADCWFMNATLIEPTIEPTLAMGIEVIGQIPRNRALYAQPVELLKKKRGRPRKYGTKMTADEVEKLSEHKAIVWLYGKHRTIRYRTMICRAKFLKGREVRVVWSRFENDKGLTESRIFISTNIEHEGLDVLRGYRKRWPIEPMFNQLKHAFGCRHLWQQKLRSVLRWMHLKMAAYALLQLLTVCKNQACLSISSLPWRDQDTTTAGMMRTALSKIIPRFPIREGWNRYWQKYEFDFDRLTDQLVCGKGKAV